MRCALFPLSLSLCSPLASVAPHPQRVAWNATQDLFRVGFRFSHRDTRFSSVVARASTSSRQKQLRHGRIACFRSSGAPLRRAAHRTCSGRTPVAKCKSLHAHAELVYQHHAAGSSPAADAERNQRLPPREHQRLAIVSVLAMARRATLLLRVPLVPIPREDVLRDGGRN